MNLLNSGYSGYHMSNRAVEAYEAGEKPLSRWTKASILSEIAIIDTNKANLFKKVSLPVLKKSVLTRSSWHHTSSRFNKTDFYSVNTDYIEEISENEILALCDKTEKSENTEERKVYKGTIYYLEWSGTRKHPKAIQKCLENVNIEEKGCFYYISDDNGTELLKKKIGSNGTRVLMN